MLAWCFFFVRLVHVQTGNSVIIGKFAVTSIVPERISQLLSKTAGCLIKDQHPLRASLKRLRKDNKSSPSLASLEKKINTSLQKVEKRQHNMPAVTYPADLPLSAKVDDIKHAILENQVVIVAGETGSGKTTQLPKLCLDLNRGVKGLIGHTQPRRLAARTVCSRIGEELGREGTSTVAYQVRFQDNSDENTYIKLMTDGILLSETRDDPFLNKYDTLIIDEAHERSLNIDFLLGYLKKLLPKRPDLKLIITSATIDLEKFSAHFSGAPIIEVSGRTYPVNIVYQPPEENTDDDLNDQVIRAMQHLKVLGKKEPIPYRDILIFLSGEKEIREVAEAIRKDKSLDMEVLPLYARLSNKEQNRAFQSHPRQRVVLATNVAETSLTVPGIGYVIDAGTARISRYSVRSKIQRLPVEAVSQASANQRAGRCGRLCPGTCIRLYSETDFQGRPEYTDTEITRTNLASVILQMLVLRLGDIEDFPFVDPPENIAVKDGFQILEELGAVNKRSITPLGRKMARFPVDPRFSRILIESASRGCLQEVLVIVSAMSIQDPRERPLNMQKAADELHARFHHPESDFVSWVKLWDFFNEQRQAFGRNKLGKFCRSNYLSWLRMSEWRDVHRQLRLVSQELKLTINSEKADYEQLHQSLLSGFVSHVANLFDNNTWLGARNRKFKIFPGSNLHGKKYSWMLSAELVETSQLFARMNARIEPQWIEKQAGSLLKYEYSEPHWEKKQGRVIAFEKVTLYGLVLAEKRRKAYGVIDPVVSREIFIREGLVSSEVNTRLSFYLYNTKLVQEIEGMEDKTRRKDILVREEDIFQLYDARIPNEVFDQVSLERWVKNLEKAEVEELNFSKEELLVATGDAPDLTDFPDRLNTEHLSLELDYQFQPGTAKDGISVEVPVSVLMQLKEEDLDWLVPGMLKEKCMAMIKVLPKPLRKNFVPVPDVIEQIMPAVKEGKGDLKAVLAHQLQRLKAVTIPSDSWKEYTLPEHLMMNINILDLNGQLIDSGRSLTRLKEKYAAVSRKAMSDVSGSSVEESGLTDWTFGELKEVHEIHQGGLTVLSWPALVDNGDSVSLKLMDTSHSANSKTRCGIARLYMLKNRQQIKYLQKELLQDPGRLSAMNKFSGRDQLVEQLIMTSYQSAFRLDEQLPRDKESFEAMYLECRGDLVEISQKLEKLLNKTLDAMAGVIKLLKKYKGIQDLGLIEDINRQIDALVYVDFLVDTPVEVLQDFPRFFQAIVQRLEKYPRQQEKDRQWSGLLAQWWGKYKDRVQQFESAQQSSESLENFRWMLEELRVSLFAQTLGTRYPVSEKRLEKAWTEIDS
jgi:ATP-dependent helicase HrpA